MKWVLLTLSLLASVVSAQGTPQDQIRQLDAQIRDMSDEMKVLVTNNFFNQLRGSSDRSLYGQEDYWATTIEFVARGAGDCEDFALAKYQTLRHAGIPPTRLLLVYAKSLNFDMAHMVVAWYPDNSGDPFILDNLTSAMRRAHNRPDLLPVYAFNNELYGLTESWGMVQVLGRSNQLRQWSEYLQSETLTLDRQVTTVDP